MIGERTEKSPERAKTGQALGMLSHPSGTQARAKTGLDRNRPPAGPGPASSPLQPQLLRARPTKAAVLH